MKIFIFYNIIDNPHGGANQFLRCLRDEFRQLGVYAETPQDASIILFNSHQHAAELAAFIEEFGQNKRFVHRLDGLQKLYNHVDDERQDLALALNKKFAHATIFQSRWAQQAFSQFNRAFKQFDSVILNAPDPHFFYQGSNRELGRGRVKLVCSSWSTNKNKGFDVYEYLDENLDFDKFEFTIIGNNPGISFKHISVVGPLSTHDLADKLRQNHLFITATKDDACSNSLLEALACGLPAVALASGGNPEIIKHAGILFHGKHDVINALNDAVDNYDSVKSAIAVATISDIAGQYIELCKSIENLQQ